MWKIPTNLKSKNSNQSQDWMDNLNFSCAYSTHVESSKVYQVK